MNNQENQADRKAVLTQKILNGVGIALCVILIPILIVNCIFIVKGLVNKDEVPSVFGLFPMFVYTDSMVPEFYGGDLIVCREIDAEDVKVGDVISFFDPDSRGSEILTHRVVEIKTEDGKLSFITQGDANNTVDTPVPAENLVGIYLNFHVRGAGKVAMFMQTTAGLVICVILPLLILVAYDIVRRKLYEKKHDSDRDELMKELEELRRMKESASQVVPEAQATSAAESMEKAEAPVVEPSTTNEKTSNE